MTARLIEPTEPMIELAAERLRAGGLVAIPTETVYGLAADATNDEAVRKVYIAKRRPIDNPLIVHVAEIEQARPFASEWSDECNALAERFWPGPLTLVVPRTNRVSDYATAGYPTVALRSPAHEVALNLIRVTDRALVAPSANQSGHVSTTKAEHVMEEFPQDMFPILDGGPCTYGIESTVLDLSDETPVVLRPGAVTLDELREVLPRVEATVIGEQVASPGTDLRHYSPRTPAVLVRTDELDERMTETEVPAVVLSLGPREACAPHGVITMPEDASAYAHRLYDALREADERHPAVILVEMPPLSGGLWRAVNDRLRRACIERV